MPKRGRWLPPYIVTERQFGNLVQQRVDITPGESQPADPFPSIPRDEPRDDTLPIEAEGLGPCAADRFLQIVEGEAVMQVTAKRAGCFGRKNEPVRCPVPTLVIGQPKLHEDLPQPLAVETCLLGQAVDGVEPPPLDLAAE